MIPPRICKSCGASYTPSPTKPGLITHCPDCSSEPVERPLRAKVAYPSKNSCEVEIEITSDVRSAALFNGQQRRNGLVLNSIVECKATFDGARL